HVLHIHIYDVDIIEREDLGKTGCGALWIDDGGGGPLRELLDKFTPGGSNMRMRQRLVENVAAAGIVEGLDAQGHGGSILHGLETRCARPVKPAAMRAQRRFGGPAVMENVRVRTTRRYSAPSGPR